MRGSFGVAAFAAVLVLGGMTAVPAAMAGTSASRPAAVTGASATITFAATAKKPFQIKAGKPFAVTSSVHGVRKGDRLALEGYYAYTKKRKPSWHVLGSWPMKAGEKSFRGIARASDPGLFTLRVQFVRKGKLLPKSQSNTFQLRVLAFKLPKLSEPGRKSVPPHAGAAAPGAATTGAPEVTLTDWTDVECANPLTVAHGVIVPSPVGAINGQLEVAQVIWARDAVPGGYWGNWYLVTVQPQYITPPQPDQFSIVEDAEAEEVTSNQLREITLDYSADTSDRFHQVAWDLEYQKPDGLWAWISPNAWYTPESFVQWDVQQIGTFQSAYCETYRTAGHS
jgi:hypothetical protein